MTSNVRAAKSTKSSGHAGSGQVKNAKISFVGASVPIVTGTTFIFAREPY
jgi:hypothetical protein